MSIRIMPLGDSITSGSQSPDSGGYRVKLSQDFQAGGLAVDFVGEFQDGPSSLPDRDHEGKPFETAAHLVSIVPNLMTSYHPDAVLLMIGTQDVQNGALSSPSGSGALKSEIAQILDEIASKLPNTTVFLSTLPPLGSDENGHDDISAANTAIRSAASAAVNKGEHVVLVEQNLTTSDLIDGVHPNATGYCKLGDTWYDAVHSWDTGTSGLVGDEIFRFYNPSTHEHFYTESLGERSTLMSKSSWHYEGVAFHSDATADTGTEVFRFYDKRTHTHFFTASDAERQHIIATNSHYRYEGVGFYAYEDSGGGAHTPVYRFYNTNNHTHFYTASAQEQQHVAHDLPSYRYEGVAYWVDLA